MAAPIPTAALRVQVSDQPPPGWGDLVRADSGSDFFHTVGWARAAVANYPNLQPIWLWAESEGRIMGGLPGLRRTTRLPLLGAVDHLESSLEGASGGPLVRDDLAPDHEAEVFRILVASFLTLRQGPLGSCSLSLNTRHEDRFGQLLINDPRWCRRDVPGAVIDLAGGQKQVEMALMKKNKRNEKNRGLRRGAEAFTTNDTRWLDNYYSLYQEASRRWGLAPVPLDFMRDLLKDNPQHAFFTCVKLKDKVIGGHLNLVFGERVIAWNGVTDPAYARTHFPATIAVWWDIVESCARGARWLDLGASGGVVTLSGFKKHFGAASENRGFYVNDSGGMKLLRRTRDVLAHLKSFLSPVPKPSRWHDGKAPDTEQSAVRDRGDRP